MDIYDSVQKIIETMERTSSTMKRENRFFGNPETSQNHKPITIESVVDQIVKACETEANRIGVPVVVAIIDLAPNKAYTSIAFRCSTAKLGESIQPGSSLYGIETMVQRPIVLFGGGEPLMCGDYLIGGLGISGGTVDEDMLIVKAGLRAFQECIKGA